MFDVLNAFCTWIATSQGLGSVPLLFYWSGFLCPWPVSLLPHVCQWLEYFIVSGQPRALAFSLHGFLLLFCSFFWTLTVQKNFSSSSVIFSSAWSDLLLRLTINFFLYFSVENCSPGEMGSFLWQPSCDFLLMMCFGGISPGLTHNMESAAPSYHNLQGCSPPYFFLTWSQEDCRPKIRKPICFIVFYFCKSILWDRVLLYGILRPHIDDENFQIWEIFNFEVWIIDFQPVSRWNRVFSSRQLHTDTSLNRSF